MRWEAAPVSGALPPIRRETQGLAMLDRARTTPTARPTSARRGRSLVPICSPSARIAVACSSVNRPSLTRCSTMSSSLKRQSSSTGIHTSSSRSWVSYPVAVRRNGSSRFEVPAGEPPLGGLPEMHHRACLSGPTKSEHAVPLPVALAGPGVWATVRARRKHERRLLGEVRDEELGRVLDDHDGRCDPGPVAPDLAVDDDLAALPGHVTTVPAGGVRHRFLSTPNRADLVPIAPQCASSVRGVTRGTRMNARSHSPCKSRWGWIGTELVRLALDSQRCLTPFRADDWRSPRVRSRSP